MRAKSVINSLPRQLYRELMPAAASKPVTVFAAAMLSSPANMPAERDEQSSSNKKQCVRAQDCGCDSSSAAGAPEEVQTERCVVCMDDFEAQEELVVFPCRHYFHIPCTEGWLAVSADYFLRVTSLVTYCLPCTCTYCRITTSAPVAKPRCQPLPKSKRGGIHT